jgi:galactokinase/mevalonate kinase-like predicted kinase
MWNAGASGGKLLGAGGFLMLYASQQMRDTVRCKLSKISPAKYSFEPQGGKIILSTNDPIL